jgi:RHS repeat-associated protein
VENPTGSVTVRLTFYIAGQSVAFKVMGGTTSSYYLYTDHLGSTSKISTTSGGAVTGTTSRYYPFGGWRTEPTTTLTDMGYTGHRHNNLGSAPDDIGLIYMNARWYLPGLGRFISADTIVPNPTNPQSYNRYSYVLNSALNFTDPTGHKECDLDCQIQNEPTNSDINFGLGWEEEWDVAQQQENQQIAAEVAQTGAEIGCGLSNTCDAAYTGYRITTGQAGWFETAAMAAPLIPAVLGRWADDALGFLSRQVDGTVGIFCSFSADTLVLTEAGVQPMSQVSPDELVWAFNEATGEMGWYSVLAVWSHEDPITVNLTIDGEVIETTPEHPFLTVEGQWLPAAALQTGDEIRNAEWSAGTVEAIEFVAQPQTMYNFTVATAHTYFVGAGQWLVHNQCRPNDVGPANVLRATSTVGDGLDIHHVPQSHPASQVIPRYNPGTAPAIALPEAVHGTIPRLRGAYVGTPRDLLANDLWNLRQAGVPNASLRQLIDLNRNTYPGVFD